MKAVTWTKTKMRLKVSGLSSVTAHGHPAPAGSVCSTQPHLPATRTQEAGLRHPRRRKVSLSFELTHQTSLMKKKNVCFKQHHTDLLVA